MIPLGFWWRNHATPQERRNKWDAPANAIATSSENDILILSDEKEQLLTRLYSPDEVVLAEERKTDGFMSDSVSWNGRHYIFMSKMGGRPKDALVSVLADHAVDAYVIFVDPYAVSVYDRTKLPPERVARLGCGDNR